MDILETEWRWRLLLARDARTESARRRLAQRARSQELTRVLRGVYVPSEAWDLLDADDRFRLRVRAAAAIDPGLVFSHAAAVATWGLPWWGSWPSRLDVLGSPMAASTTVLRRHAEPCSSPVSIEGILVTGLARTTVDVARGPDLARAVAIADAALSPRTRLALRAPAATPDLEGELAAVPFRHGEARARHVVDFADGRSESAGESVSRVTIDRIGLPSAVLQHEFRTGGRTIGRVDFWWPEDGVAGEFDGRGKYLDPRLRGGRSAEQVVYDEKRREDAIRSRPEVRSFARWGWAEAASPAALAAILRGAGVGARPSRATDAPFAIR
jgi:hypothetical protein